MATSPKEAADAGEPEGVEPLRGRLVVLSARRTVSAAAGRAENLRDGSYGKLYRIGLQFTPDDHASLAAWVDDTGHGYHRLEVEQGLLEDGSCAGYALVYRLSQAWSTWGITRRGDHLEVWRCATGKTVGCYARMATALASLPHATDHQRAFQVMMGDESTDRPVPTGRWPSHATGRRRPAPGTRQR